MRNFTFKKISLFKLISFFIFFLLINFTASAQFYTKHYIAPAPWQYFSKANEIVIATNSVAEVNITVNKSDGTLITSLKAKKGTPAVYRFPLLAKNLPMNALDTVLTGAGLIVTSDGPIAINLRNIASDDYSNGDNVDANIKGNAALTSFGDAGIGVRFRIGYYRDGSLGTFSTFGDQRPIYSIMATVDNTSVKIDNVVKATLNAGQSYMFKAPMGTLVESSNPSVMNTSAAIDVPGGCGDGAFNQIPPESVLGTEYFLERGTGNNTAEQTTVVATKDDTKITIEGYSATGALVSTTTQTLAQAGKFYTFVNGVPGTSFTASHIVADKRVAVYSGTAQNCEVDISTIAPVSECGGSNFIETTKFKNYASNNLDYFGYILLRSATEIVTVNGTNIASISGIPARYQIGSTGWYLINFNSVQIGSPEVLSIASNAKLTVSIVQQAGGFSMAGFFSSFAALPDDPTMAYVSGGGCNNNTATLTTPSGFAPYQWYYNGTAISGANSNTYIATRTGSYAVASTLACGVQTQSKPVSVTLCTDLGVTKTVDNATPCVGSNVEFTVTLSNLGVNNATGVSINDLLPTGYTYVSSVASIGNYNSATGVWSIGDVDGGVSRTLKITAKVNPTGVYNNTAALPNSTVDSNLANNSASVSTTPKALPVALSLTGSTICVPASGGTITSTTSVTNVNYQLYNSANNAVQAVKAGTGSGLTWSGLSAGTGYYVISTSAGMCTSTSNAVAIVADTQKPTITCPSNVTKTTDTNSCTATGVVLGTPTTADNCGVASVTNNAPGSYPIGVTTVTWTVTDNSGNTQTCTQTVTVTDTQKPTITCPANVTKTTDANSCTATGVVLGTPTTADNCGVASVTNNAPGSYPIGVTTVTWTVTDNSGNTQTCTQTVTITDTQKPTITCPANVTKTTDANSCTATGVVLGTPTTADNCGVASVTNNAPTTYPIGVTTVTWTVTDNSGNTQTCTQTVTVTDTQKPTITCPANVTKTTDANSCTATGVVLGTPTTADNCGIASVTNNAPGSYPIGVTTVTWTVTDNSGNTQTCTQSVTVTDTQKPTITCPANVTKTTDANSCTATGVVLGTPTTADNCGVASVTNNAPGSYPIGVTTVTWTVTDNSGNTQTCTQIVTISDTQKPTITCPSNVTKTTDANSCTATGVVLGTPTTADNCGVASVTNNAPTTYPIGVTTVAWTVTDNSGNTQTCTQTVTVTDTQKPTITCPANVTKTTDANSCTATGVVLGTPTTADNCGVASVTNNAPGSYPIGVTTVTWTVTDNSGNTQTCTQSVTVTDTQKPTITCPANVTKTTDANSCTATGIVLGTPTTADNCGVASVTNNAPGSYPIGVTTVTWTVTDNSGNTQTCTQSVTVTDTQKPTITCPANVTKTTDANSCTATGVVLGTPTTADNCGVASVTNNAPGSYPIGVTTVTWTVTDNSGNTETCTQNVNIVGPILAKDDNVASFNGYVGGTAVSNVLNNDLLNCNAVIGNDVTIALASSLPSVLSFNASTGSVAVKPNTPAGTYTFDYTICENLNSTNCSTATVSISVVAPSIDAVAENLGSINGNAGGTTTVSLIASDTVNGTQAVIGTTPGDVKLTVTTPIPTGLTINTNGTVTVAANTTAGSYNLEYTICEINNPGNCDTATSTVVVTAPVIDAVADNLGSINGNAGGTTAISLIAGDTVNAAQAVIGTNPGEVKLTVTTPIPAGLTINTNGTVTVGANTPAGTYNLEYTICEINNPGNCDTATSTVVVTAGVLVANLDTVPATLSSNTPKTLINVFDNDTKNGTALIPSDVKLTVTTADPKGYLTVDVNGNAILGANAPAGTYELTYEICELLNPTNCSSNQVQVTITAPSIDAVADNLGSVNGNAGGTTTVSLIASDTVNGAQAVIGTNPGDVKLTVTTPIAVGLTINTNGTVTVTANTPAGSYNLEYTICEINNPGNCDTATSTIVVTAGVLVANLDTVPATLSSNTPKTLINVFDNDTKNGTALIPSDVKLTVTTADPKGYLTVDVNGNAILGANAPAGTYELTYQICELLNPTNCSSNQVKVTITAPGIDAVADNLGSINGNAGGTTTVSLIAGDTVNGTQAVIGTNPGEVKLTVTTPIPAGLTINTNGTITVAANTPAGSYNLEYTICEINNPGNCDTATSTIVVTAGVLVANLDTVPATLSSNTPKTLLNVFDNDTKNGAALIPSDVKLMVTTADPKGYLTVDVNGNAILGANAPSGTYELTYEICELLNPTNCSSNQVQVTITAPGIDAVADNLGSINGNAGGTTTVSLIAGDTVNGAQAVIGTNPGEVKLTVTTPIPAGLTINTNGTVTVGANTPAGTYNLEYTICEINNPGNCDTATSTVVVTAPSIDAVADNLGSINGNTGGTTTISLIAGDTVNAAQAVIGTNPGDVKLTVTTPIPTGLTINTNGTVTVGANTPAGSYNLEYTICEINNPSNCDTATSTIVVTAATLVANLDTVPATLSSNTPKTLVNVFDNDTKNGAALIPSDVKLTVTTADPKGYLTVDVNGNAILGANAPAGTYELTYEICELLNPTNCSSNQVKVTITAPGIDAVADNLGSINGNAGGTTTVSLIESDTVNGTQAVIGTNPGEVKLTVTTPIPAGLTINTNGTVTVGANTPAGSYNLEYTICEINNPGNCDTATSTIVVTAATLVANLDAVPSTLSSNAPKTLINVFDNDTKNGAALIPSDVKLTVTTADPKGYLTVDVNGNTILAANAPAGTYELTYEICELLNPTNCSSNQVKVTITAPSIDAVADNLGSVNGNAGGTTTVSLIEGDTVNGAQAVIGTNPGDVKLTVTTPIPAGLTINTNGTIAVAANTPAGTYNLEYTICEINNPGNCDTATSTIVVTAATLVANLDEVPSTLSSNTPTTLINVFDNDTKNGAALIPSDVKLTVTTADPKGYLTVDVNGNAILGANAPAGTYELTYEICELLNPTNCSSNQVQVTITAPGIDAVADNLGSINGNAGGTTTVSLIAGDTVNGAQAVIGTNPGEVKLTVTTPIPAGLTINTNGTVTVGVNTPAGSYNLEYTICEINNPGNCDTATSTVVVTAPVIDAVADNLGSVNGNAGGTTTVSLIAADTVNGTQAVIGTNPGEVKLTVTTPIPSGLTINTNGTVTVAANTPAGSYNLEYTICEINNPGNCDTATSTVVVTAGVLVANLDAVPSTLSSNTPKTLINVFDNDTKNGTALIPSDVKLTVTTADPKGYLTVDVNGNAILGANAPAGTYELTYEICELLNPTNCSSNQVKVTITAPGIDAVADNLRSINGNAGGTTTVSLIAGDTVNGAQAVIGTNPGEVKLTVTTPIPAGLTINTNGTVTVAANTPAGTYNLEYTICEINNPGNCDTATSTVVVTAPVIDAVADNLGSVNGNAGGTTTVSLIAADTVNAAQAVIGTNPGEVKLTVTTPIPAGLTINTNGTVTVGANTPAGSYNLEYTICEINNPGNCDTATSTVVVTAGVLVANLDTVPATLSSNTPKTLINVFDNDTKNGAALIPSDVKLTVTIADPKGYLTVDVNGNAILGANAPAGTYELTYEICELLNPTNCSSNQVKVTITAPGIDAVAENLGSINGNAGGTTTVSLIAGDTVNGAQAVIGTNPGDVKLTVTTPIPAGLTINTNGTIAVAANTPAGTYNLEYTICEINNPGNCDTATSTIVVTAATLVANLDAVPSTLSSNTPKTLVNVFDNDTKNGAALIPSDVKLTVTIADPKGYLTVDVNGNAILGANAPAGTYELTYEICELLNPTNCSSNQVKVTITAPGIDAVAENLGSINGNAGGTTTVSLIEGDTVNGTQAVIGTNPGDVKLTVTTPIPAGLTINTNGTVTVGANTPAGSYNLEYTICEINNQGNCDTATSTIVVTSATLVANLDAVPSTLSSNTPKTLINVFDNDTKNGAALIPSDVKLTVTTADPKGYLTVDTNGNAILGANAPAGTYELTYQICELLNPANCSSNQVKVTITAPGIDAVADNLGSINGNTGGTTTVSLIASDTVNGTQAVIGTNPGDVKLTVTTPIPAGMTINTNGTVTVAANTTAGTYNLEYTICEINNPGNCDTATSTVVVTAPSIDAVAENLGSISGNTGGTTTVSLIASDTVNAAQAVIGTNPGDVKLIVTTPIPAGLTINTNGTVTVAANTLAGSYNLEYTICEINNPGNCDTATSTIVVTAGVLVANLDAVPSTLSSNAPKTLVNVFDNDTKNGAALIPSDVKLTVTTADPKGYLTVDTNGNAILGANAPAGTYELTYQICELLNPTNCSSNQVQVTITAPGIDAVADNLGSINGNTGGTTTVSLIAADTVNGAQAVIGTNPGDVKLTVTTPIPAGLTINSNGTVTVGANTPAGTYNLEYTICEISNPGNCDTAISTIIVTAEALVANDDIVASVVGANQPKNLLNIFSNDTKNGFPVVAAEMNLTETIPDPTGFVKLNPDGTVVLSANTPAGTYEITYQICEKLNPTNCSTASIKVTVIASTVIIQAKDDVAGPIDASKGVSTSLNIFANDTLNGSAINPADAVLTTVIPNANLILNADGSVDVKLGTPSGSYQLTYQICEVANPSNCSQAVVTITVLNTTSPINPTAPIVANDDAEVAVDGINGALEFVNVLDNDLLNGTAINATDVIITKTSASPNFELNADGTVNVLPNTPGGQYTVTYQICEKVSATNCSSATLHVFVEFPAIAIIKTAVFNDENASGFANAGETITYKFKITNTGNVPLKGITVRDPLPGIEVSGEAIDLDVNETDENTFTAQYKIKQSDINLGSVSNQATAQGVSVRGVVVEDKSDKEDNLGDKPTVLALNGCMIEPLKAFSPNGDNKNTRFYIRGIECYPENTVEIYNRWGVLVYDADHYNNEDRVFKGFSEGRATVKQSDGLPVGTYFYILKYKDSASNSHELSGYLYMNK